MTEQVPDDTTTQPSGTAAGDILSQLIRDVGETVRREVGQVRADAAERAAGGARGAGLLAAAGVSGTIALGAAASLPLIALRRLLPGWAIALLVAGGAGAGAAVLARRGLSELGAAAPIDTDSVKDAARQAVRSLG